MRLESELFEVEKSARVYARKGEVIFALFSKGGLDSSDA
jgi:hypothetical protein